MSFLKARQSGTFGAYAAALCCCAALAGCGGKAPLFTSDGRPTTMVQCSSQGPWDTCEQNARGICQGDFDVVKRSTDSTSRNLLFACKAKQAQ
jgi:predicted small lipoprotein YifL